MKIVKFDQLESNHVYRITHASFSRNDADHWVNTFKYVLPGDELIFFEFSKTSSHVGPFRLMKKEVQNSYKKQLFEDLGHVKYLYSKIIIKTLFEERFTSFI